MFWSHLLVAPYLLEVVRVFADAARGLFYLALVFELILSSSLATHVMLSLIHI